MPHAPARVWKYDSSVKEYFVETNTKQTIRVSETHKRTEIEDKGDLRLHKGVLLGVYMQTLLTKLPGPMVDL